MIGPQSGPAVRGFSLSTFTPRPSTLPMAHSVEGHLKLKIAEYDQRIRLLVCAYEAMRTEQLALLARCLPRTGPSTELRIGGLVLDLGGGTGALAAAVAERFPEVRVQIWD